MQRFLLFVIVLVHYFLPQTGVAQENKAKLILEETIVTARKKFDTVQDVPISMAVRTGADIQARSIVKLEDLSLYIPNVQVSEAGIAQQLFIRGVGSGVNTGFEQTVGTFVDGVYYGRGQLARSPFFDLERVEILKGPQSILFGKNTVAGTLNITSAAPTSEFEGMISGLLESQHGEQKLEGYISGPVTDKLLARLAYRFSELDGWVENTTPGKSDEPEQEENAIRLSADYSVNDDLDISARLALIEFNTTGRQSEILSCGASLLGALALNGFSDDCSQNQKKSSGGSFVPATNAGPGYDFSDQYSETDTITLNVTADYRRGDYEWVSVTSFSEYDFVEQGDADQSALSFFNTTIEEEYEQFAEELRVTYLGSDIYEWVSGIYIQKSELKGGGNINASLLQLPTFPAISGSTNNNFDQDSETWSVFAQYKYQLTDEWIATIGARYTDETKDVNKELFIAELGGSVPTTDPVILGTFQAGLGVGEHVFEKDRSENGFNPSVTIEYNPNFDTRYYFSATTGFKGGGFDAVLTDGNEDFFEYEEEKVTSFELGGKFRLENGRGNIQVALFRSEFEDVQTSTFNGTTGFNVSNAGEILSQGLEIESRYRIFSSLTAGLIYSYLDSEYTDFDGAQCFNGQTAAEGCVGGVRSLKGERTQFSPEHSASAYLNYEQLLGKNTLSVDFEIFYSDNYYVITDLDPVLDQNSYTKFNLRIGFGNDIWEVAFVGKNLTDEITSTWANDIPLFDGSYFIFNDRGRSTALQFNYYF